jgi:hypothetical protein
MLPLGGIDADSLRIGGGFENPYALAGIEWLFLVDLAAAKFPLKTGDFHRSPHLDISNFSTTHFTKSFHVFVNCTNSPPRTSNC